MHYPDTVQGVREFCAAEGQPDTCLDPERLAHALIYELAAGGFRSVGEITEDLLRVCLTVVFAGQHTGVWRPSGTQSTAPGSIADLAGRLNELYQEDAGLLGIVDVGVELANKILAGRFYSESEVSEMIEVVRTTGRDAASILGAFEGRGNPVPPPMPPGIGNVARAPAASDDLLFDLVKRLLLESFSGAFTPAFVTELIRMVRSYPATAVIDEGVFHATPEVPQSMFDKIVDVLREHDHEGDELAEAEVQEIAAKIANAVLPDIRVMPASATVNPGSPLLELCRKFMHTWDDPTKRAVDLYGPMAEMRNMLKEIDGALAQQHAFNERREG